MNRYDLRIAALNAAASSTNISDTTSILHRADEFLRWLNAPVRPRLGEAVTSETEKSK